MRDSDFLNWIADRIVKVYGESENVDFVLKLRELAKQKNALSRVCDDAERWNAHHALSDSSGYDAITVVRSLYKVESGL